MYNINTTQGFIIGSRPYGEANRILSIFTRDFGLVSVIASGIRLEKSKLRYHTVEYSLGEFSMVKGKEFWRLTSSFGNRMSKSVKVGKTGLELVARIALLLKRLLHGEEEHVELFGILESCILFLEQDEQVYQITDEQMKTLESVTILRILHVLGYIGDNIGFEECLKSREITIGLLDNFKDKRTLINQHINKALRESHL